MNAEKVKAYTLNETEKSRFTKHQACSLWVNGFFGVPSGHQAWLIIKGDHGLTQIIQLLFTRQLSDLYLIHYLFF